MMVEKETLRDERAFCDGRMFKAFINEAMLFFWLGVVVVSIEMVPMSAPHYF